MADDTFFELFVRIISLIQDGQKQIEESLPKISEKVESEDLKESFKIYWIETKEQLGRLDKAFALSSTKPVKVDCHAVSCILEDLFKRLQRGKPSAVRDAEIIAAFQSIEHYQIGLYGTLKTFAQQFNYKDIVELFTETLREITNTDKTLSAIAEGGYFTSGINQEAAKMNPGKNP